MTDRNPQPAPTRLRLSFRLPSEVDAALDRAVSLGKFPNRTAALEYAVMSYDKSNWKTKKIPTLGLQCHDGPLNYCHDGSTTDPPPRTRRPHITKPIFNTMADIRITAKKFGGNVVKDGCGGFEVMAPDGFRWKEAEVSCYPIPLNEAQSREEKYEMIETAGEMLSAGIEPLS